MDQLSPSGSGGRRIHVACFRHEERFGTESLYSNIPLVHKIVFHRDQERPRSRRAKSLTEITMNSTRIHHTFNRAVSRWRQGAGILAVSLFMHCTTQAQVTLGDALIDGGNDGNSGGVYIYTNTFGQAGTAETWSFFDDDDFSPNRNVTPLLFQKVDSSTFMLTGVGTTVTSNESGAQTDHAFGLIAGSADVDTDYTFGFTDRILTYGGSGNVLNTSLSNGGVVDHQSIGGVWAFVPSAEGTFSIILGQSYVIDAPTDADDSIISLYGVVSRQYSAQLTTAAVPEPAAMGVWMGGLILGSVVLKRRKRLST